MSSISKGKSFEREIALLLSQSTGSQWHRVPQSGGLSEDRSQACYQGDVYSEDKRYAGIVVECKHWAKLTINHLFLAKSIMHSAILQAKRESKGQAWLLFIKSNNQGILMITDALHSTKLEEITKNIPQFTMPMALGPYNISKVLKQ